MNISVCVCARNEEDRIPILTESLTGIDDLVLLDNGSTDKTAKIARELGWRVIPGWEIDPSLKLDYPSKEDIAKFKDHFGFDPSFDTKSELWNEEKMKEYLISHAKNDWVFCPDCDEIVTWDLDAIQQFLPNVDLIRHRYIHSRDEHGNPQIEFNNSKFFDRTKAYWAGRIHGVVIAKPGTVCRATQSDKVKIDHYQTMGKAHRLSYLQHLEYTVIENLQDARALYYLGREYMYYERYSDSEKVLKEYLALDGWNSERSEAYSFLSDMRMKQDDFNGARDYLHLAMAEDCNRRDPFFKMASHYYDKGMFKEAIPYLLAAAGVQLTGDVISVSKDLDWRIPDMLSICYWYVGLKDTAKYFYNQLVELDLPDDQRQRILDNGTWLGA